MWAKWILRALFEDPITSLPLSWLILNEKPEIILQMLLETKDSWTNQDGGFGILLDEAIVEYTEKVWTVKFLEIKSLVDRNKSIIKFLLGLWHK